MLMIEISNDLLPMQHPWKCLIDDVFQDNGRLKEPRGITYSFSSTVEHT